MNPFDFDVHPNLCSYEKRFDWCAISKNYEGGDPVGYGSTPEEALEDLLIEMEVQDAL